MTSLTEKQQICYEYFRMNLPDWLKNPLKMDKYVVIFSGKLVGIYDSIGNAVNHAYNTYRQGEFIIQQIVDEREFVSCRKYVV